MEFQVRVWHFVAMTALLLIGVPSNGAVIWIHTRKNSRVAKNKFPLIFAVIDLIALLVTLPLQLSIIINDHLPPDTNGCFRCEIRSGVGIYVINSCDGRGQAMTNGTYMCDVTPFQQQRAATASESLDVLVARVVWPSGSELHATLSSPVSVRLTESPRFD